MSLVVTSYVPEGIVMASDSRQSITIQGKTPDGKEIPKVDTINSDNVYKTFLLEKLDKNEKPCFQVGVSAFGQDLLGGISTASHMKRFTEKRLADSDYVETIAEKIVDFFKKDFPGADIGFHVAGYKKEEKVSVPYIFYCSVKKDQVERRNLKPDKTLAYGATWSGQIDILAGIVQPSLMPGLEGKVAMMHKPPIIWDAMALQDAIDFSIYAIRTTIDTIRFQARPKNVGGPIDVLVITPEKVKWVQKKELKGESNGGL
ncbi:MAG: hypothetical protein AAB785_00250 [Patescibacteria group bacterium]